MTSRKKVTGEIYLTSKVNLFYDIIVPPNLVGMKKKLDNEIEVKDVPVDIILFYDINSFCSFGSFGSKKM